MIRIAFLICPILACIGFAWLYHQAMSELNRQAEITRLLHDIHYLWCETEQDYNVIRRGGVTFPQLEI
jgi:hypothetical protein